MAKRSLADLAPAKHPGVSYRSRLDAKQSKRLDQLLGEFLELKAAGRAPKVAEAAAFITAELGWPLSPATLFREIASYDRKNA